MNKRSCPNCQNTLGSHDQFYCTKCGVELPENLIFRKSPARLIPYAFGVSDSFGTKVHDYFAKSKEKKSFLFLKKYFALVIPVFFVAIVVVTITILDKTGIYSGDFFSDYYKAYQAYYNELPLPAFMKSSPVPLSKPLTKIEAAEILNLDLALESKVFDSGKFLGYVPYEADLYVQVSDLDGFNNEYVLTGISKESSMSSISKNLKDHFAFFGVTREQKRDFAFIFEAENKSALQNAVANFEDPVWRVKFIGDVIVFATSEELFEEIDGAFNKVDKNLSLNPDFVKIDSRIPHSGQILFIGLHQEPTNAVLLDLVKNKKLHKELVTYIERVLNDGDLQFVVTNLR